MDADRRNNFINSKPNNVDVSKASTTPTNGSNNNSSSNEQTSENGTIGSSSDSIEPPKQQQFINSNRDFTENINMCNVDNNEQSKQSDKQNINMDKYTDSVLQKQTDNSNEENKKILNCVLSENELNHVSDVKIQENSPDVINNSNSIVLLEKQINNQNVNVFDKNQLNGDDNTHNHLTGNNFNNSNDNFGTRNVDNNSENTTIKRCDNNLYSNGGRCINKSDNSDCFNRSNSNVDTNTLNENNSSASINLVHSGDLPTNELLVQNSSEDCVSSTDTFSSDIDVKPTISTTNKSQTAIENQEIACNSNEIKKNPERVECSKSQMDVDHSLKEPLLGKNSSRNNSIDYNAIERHDKNAKIQFKGNNNDIDINGKSVAYNDYVNLLCDTDKNKIFSLNNGRKASNSVGIDENRPLLQQSMSYDGNSSSGAQKFKRRSIQKPTKSIVKSPSTQNFSSNNSEKFYEANRKPRLSIQCSGSDPERPVLHVQFLSQHLDDNSSSNSDPKVLKGNSTKPYSPSNAEQTSSQANAASQQEYFIEKQPEELINEMPTRSILRPSNMRSSMSSNSTGSSSSSSSSDSSSSDDVSQFAEAKPPDGGYGWVIVFASFMVNLIADGITFSFGVIFTELLKYFGEGKAKTAWIGSLFMAMPLLSGPVASFLTDRYGCRKVTIVGSILAAIGFIISSFTDSIAMLCLTFGIFAGFGLSMCYVAAVVVVAYYFDKRRSLATGLSVCGSGIGMCQSIFLF